MGRKPFGTLYQKKGDPNWRVELKGRGVVELKTNNRSEAQSRLASILRQKASASRPSIDAESDATKSPKSPDTLQSSASGVSTSIPVIEHDFAASVLGAWAASKPVEESEDVPDDMDEQLAAAAADDEPSDAPPETGDYIPPPPSGGRRKKSGLTPEQVAKLASGMKKAVVKANIVLDEMLIGFMGRNPCELDDDEVEMLEVGWEMVLEEMFGRSKPEPWMIVAAGNVAVLLAMYVRGESKDADKPIPFTPVP